MGGRKEAGESRSCTRTMSTTATLFLNYNWNDAGSGANLYYRPDSPTDYSLQVADGTQPEYLRGLYSVALKLDQEMGDHLALTSITSYFHSYSGRHSRYR